MSFQDLKKYIQYISNTSIQIYSDSLSIYAHKKLIHYWSHSLVLLTYIISFKLLGRHLSTSLVPRRGYLIFGQIHMQSFGWLTHSSCNQILFLKPILLPKFCVQNPSSYQSFELKSTQLQFFVDTQQYGLVGMVTSTPGDSPRDSQHLLELYEQLT